MIPFPSLIIDSEIHLNRKDHYFIYPFVNHSSKYSVWWVLVYILNETSPQLCEAYICALYLSQSKSTWANNQSTAVGYHCANYK